MVPTTQAQNHVETHFIGNTNSQRTQTSQEGRKGLFAECQIILSETEFQSFGICVKKKKRITVE